MLKRAGTEREWLQSIKQRKLSYLGNTMNGDKYEVLRLISMGKIE